MHSNKNNFLLPVRNLLTKISQQTEDANPPYVGFGIFGLITYPLYHLIWLLATPQDYDSFILRLIATALCLPLAFKNMLPKKLDKYLPIYWNLTLLYCLPFLFTFLLLKNDFSYTWAMNTMTALVLCILLLDLLQLSILLPLGIVFGVLCYWLTTNNPILLPPNYLIIAIAYSSIIIFGALFAHRRNMIQKEKINAMAAVGGSIAHELRNPLLAINTNLNGIKKYVPFLLTGYQKANANNLLEDKEKIRLDRFEVLLTAVDDIGAEIQYANTMINMLLLKVKPNIKSGEVAICSIFDCVDDALRRYPFNSAEQSKLINWNMEVDKDFKFKGSQLLIIHVLFNLIKNALYFVDDAGKGQIYISTSAGKKNNTLHFKDTAKGIPAHILPRLFTRFFTKTDTGTGLGLAFCKMVMTGMGGDITCRSQEGEYTEFILTFPKLDEAEQPVPLENIEKVD